jgi:hypothetical protein
MLITRFNVSMIRKRYRSIQQGRPAGYLLILAILLLTTFGKPVEAAVFTNLGMRHSRMAISIANSGTDPILVIMRPATVGTEVSIGISFASGYTVNGTYTNITVSTVGDRVKASKAM